MKIRNGFVSNSSSSSFILNNRNNNSQPFDGKYSAEVNKIKPKKKRINFNFKEFCNKHITGIAITAGIFVFSLCWIWFINGGSI